MNHSNVDLDTYIFERQQRRRKYFSTFDSSVEPYISRNCNIATLLSDGDPVVPNNWQTALDLNNLWMLYYSFGIAGSKRWFAWNCERTIDENPEQLIGYLPNINQSPTSDAVVQKTLNIAKDIAEECGQRNIIVTYDLAIASKAYRIQANLSPAFDNVFINLGSFHVQMSFFKVIDGNIRLCIIVTFCECFILFIRH